MESELKMIELNEELEEKYQLFQTLQASIEKIYLTRDGTSGLYFLIQEINNIDSSINASQFQNYVFKERIVFHHAKHRLFRYVETEDFYSDFNHFHTWWPDYRGGHLSSSKKLEPGQFVEEMGDMIPIEIRKAIVLFNSVSLDAMEPKEFLYIICTYLDLLQWLRRKFDSELHIIVFDSEKRERIRSELRQKMEWNGSGEDFSYLMCRLFRESWIQISGNSFRAQADFLLSHFKVSGTNGILSSGTLTTSIKRHAGVELKRPFTVEAKKKK